MNGSKNGQFYDRARNAQGSSTTASVEGGLSQKW